MKTLITGATGFLGTALSQKLKAQGHNLTLLDSKNCDLRQQTSLERFSSAKFDQIYHLAAWTQAGDFCLHHPGEQWIFNQQINTNLLSWWQNTQPQAKLICMGTSCAYSPELPMVETNYLEGSPIESLYTYALSKRMLYVGLKALNLQYGLNYLYLVPSTLYGPGYHQDGRQMHFIFDLIRKIVRGKTLDKPVVLWGDGHQRRELVFVGDSVDFVVALAERANNDIVNIGAGYDLSIRQFAEIICEIVGFDAEAISYDTSRYTGAQAKLLDTSKLQSLLPEITYTSLNSGLQQTIDWMRERSAVLQ
ncbi:MAG TPA: NAD-dependent epimerase/dehydratase family protein [Candidatus Melainabacteria bacterium]|nr:NAD-dependent epimerase/dehydratase family protein [Candidatus Melainabacteria bacterium]